MPTTARTLAHGLWAKAIAAYLIAMALQFCGNYFELFVTPEVACRKGFGHLVAIVADF